MKNKIKISKELQKFIEAKIKFSKEYNKMVRDEIDASIIKRIKALDKPIRIC
jgi:hypothetical protein